ncbi:MFS transporter [Corynebacterium pacaense]|uniref:MFS transporter n=1 Tax=Corynebacterium pacaense TaxID=1816684 RepID=UPI0009BB6372|nr:MFS transporter [Corynebacterium pacaense]
MASDRISRRALIVWLSAVLIYVMAITGRTSFGVAGVDAIERFGIDASRVAVFTSVQLGVYALAQIPTGILVDRFGPRRLLVAGALVMAAGQILLGVTSSYGIAIGARVLIGCGDATAFLSVMRLLPSWFPIRRTPVFTQLTGAIGQVGQFLSAVPFLALLGASGWTTAFVSLGAAGALVALAGALVVRDTPVREPQVAAVGASISGGRILDNLRLVVTSPYCWQGLFTHWTNMFPLVVFQLLWGMPMMTLGLGLSTAQVGMVLTLSTIGNVIGGPFAGITSARLGRRRDAFALGTAVLQALLWTYLFFPATPHGNAFLAAAVVSFFAGMIVPAANFGFDTVRERVDRSLNATGTGFANMGGFSAAMLSTQLLGLLLDRHSHGQAYAWADFRYAWLAVLVVWLLGIIGYAICLLIVSRHQRPRPRVV